MRETVKDLPTKSVRFKLFKNISWNWIGIGLQTALAFIVCPFLISYLGTAKYGIWVTIGAITGYFGLLDLGIKSSVGRYVAYYRSQKELDLLNGSIQTAIALLFVLSSFAFACLFFGLDSLVSFTSEDFTEVEVTNIKTALFLSGIHLWILLPANAFEGVIWGCQRFDYLNQITAPVTIIRGVGSIVLVWMGHGLVALALLGLITTFIAAVVKYVVSRKLIPTLNFSFRGLKRRHLFELFSFGFANSIRSITHALPAKLAPIGIAIYIGVESVAPMSIAARLVAAATAILVAGAGVLTPLATSYHAQNNQIALKKLHINGGRYLFCAGIFFGTLFYTMGRELIINWVGPEFESAYYLLLILACGRCLSGSQIVTRAIITAQAKQWPLAYASIAQASIVIGFGYYLLQYYGLYEFVMLVALADVLFEAGFSMFYGCIILKVSILKYLKQVFSSSCSLLIPSVTLLIFCRHYPAAEWFQIILYGLLYSLFALLFFMVFVEQKLISSIFSQGAKRNALSNRWLLRRYKYWR